MSRRGGRAAAGLPGRWERMLFSVMGPPQVGDVNAPRAFPADTAAELCDKCGQSWAEHARVRTDSRTYITCPERQAT